MGRIVRATERPRNFGRGLIGRGQIVMTSEWYRAKVTPRMVHVIAVKAFMSCFSEHPSENNGLPNPLYQSQPNQNSEAMRRPSESEMNSFLYTPLLRPHRVLFWFLQKPCKNIEDQWAVFWTSSNWTLRPKAEFMNGQIGHNLGSSKTWGFCMDFFNHREGGMVFYNFFLLSTL